MMTEEDTIDRDEVARLNRDELVRLMNQYGLFIAQRQLDQWRPTTPTRGTVDGFWHLGTMTCVATDGLQAYFILDNNKPWLGHVGHFHWNEPVVTLTPYINEDGVEEFFKSIKAQGAPSAFARRKPKLRAPKPKKEKVSLIDKAIRLLMKGSK